MRKTVAKTDGLRNLTFDSAFRRFMVLYSNNAEAILIKL